MICERKCPVHGYGLSIGILFLVHQTFLVLSNQTERIPNKDLGIHLSLTSSQPATLWCIQIFQADTLLIVFLSSCKPFYAPQSPDQLCCEACKRTIERRHRRFKQRMRSAQITALFFFFLLDYTNVSVIHCFPLFIIGLATVYPNLIMPFF